MKPTKTSKPRSTSSPVKPVKPVKPGKPRAARAPSKPPSVSSAGLHTSKKSGYAGSIPGTVQNPAAVPPAMVSGRQVGVVPPAERAYGKAKYQAVDLNTAIGRMKLRVEGAMPVISGGLDEQLSRYDDLDGRKPSRGTPAEPCDQAESYDQYSASDSEWGGESDYSEAATDKGKFPPVPGYTGKPVKSGAVFDPGANNILSVDSGDSDSEVDVFDAPVGHVGARRGRVPDATGAGRHGNYSNQYVNTVANPSKPDKTRQYLSRRVPVTVELTDTVVNLQAIDVIVMEYGITIVLPMIPGGGTFTPKPGSAVNVKFTPYDSDNPEPQAYDCYFPGTEFELPELEMAGLVFIRA